MQDKAKLIQYATQYIEYRNNPLKFIREQVKIPLPGGSTLFRPYNKQIELVKEFLEHHYLLILKSRQIGISTIVQAIIVWLTTFYDNAIIGVISRDGPEATDFARKVMAMIDELSPEFRPKFVKKTEQSFILDNNSALYVGIVNPTKPGAVFRGKALTLLVIDEAAFISNMDEAYTAITPALLKAHKVAQERNIPFGSIIMSTPNGTVREGAWFYEMWTYATQNPGDPYYPLKIHWKDIPEFADDPGWYEQQCKLFKYDKRKIAQELDLVFLSPASSLFTPDTVEILQKVSKEPTIKKDIREGGRKVGEFWIWQDKARPDMHVVIGVDPATAHGSSRSAVQVFDVLQMTQLAEVDMKGEVTTLQYLLDKTILPMYPKALLVIEANSIGNQLIEYFSKSKWMMNLYYRPVQNPRLQVREFRPGLVNDTKIRPLIIDALYTCVTQFTEGIKSERLVLQLIGLKEVNHRIQGSPDDLCLAYGFIAYIRQYAQKHIITQHSLSPETEDSIISIVNSNMDEMYNNSNIELTEHTNTNELITEPDIDLSNIFFNEDNIQ